MRNAALPRLAILALLAAAALPPAFGGGDILIKNATILTVTKGVIPKGDILVVGGVIREVGGTIAAPPGVRVVDAAGRFVLPGLIDSHTHIALAGTNEGSEAVTPEADVGAVINADDTAILTALSGGVTMVHTMHGSANPIGGPNVVLKMKWGRPSEDLVVGEALPTLKFALGENVKQSNRTVQPGQAQRYPATRMGVNAIIRREFAKARHYMARWDRYNQAAKAKNPPPTLVPPRRDLRLEVLAEVLRGQRVARVHSYQATETLEFMELAKELGFKIQCFEHIWEGFKIADELAAAGIGISVFADSWAYKMEAAEGVAGMAGYCHNKGVLVSINSDSGERIRRLFNDAAKTMKYGGLTEDEALRLITINPAIQLGVDRIAGSLEVGKQGDLAVFDGHPMSAYARCDMTIIEGDVYFDREALVKERVRAEEEAARADQKAAAPRARVGLAAPLRPAPATPGGHKVIAITNARIIPVVGAEVPKGTIVIENGLIAAVGADVAVPAGAEVFDAAGLRAYPGMIDGYSSLGLVEISGVAATVDNRETGRVNPQVRSLEAVRYDSMHIPIARSNGITAAVVAPAGGVVSGVSCLLRLDGWTNREMAVVPAVAMHIELPGLRGGRGGFGGGRGAEQPRVEAPALLAELKRLFAEARAYEKRRDAAAGNKRLALPEFDETAEALLPMIKGEMPALISVHGERDIRAAIRFVREEGLKAVFYGVEQGFKAANELAEAGIPVIFGSLYDSPPVWEDGYDALYRNPGILAKAGVKIAFSSSSASVAKDLPYHAAKAVAFGLDKAEALKAVTINAAAILGVDGIMGSLEQGKAANIVLADGDILELRTNIKKVYIDGRETDLSNRYTELLDKFDKR